MSLDKILETAAFALEHSLIPMICFLCLQGVAVSSISVPPDPPDVARSRAMLWAAGIFMLVGEM